MMNFLGIGLELVVNTTPFSHMHSFWECAVSLARTATGLAVYKAAISEGTTHIMETLFGSTEDRASLVSWSLY